MQKHDSFICAGSSFINSHYLPTFPLILSHSSTNTRISATGRGYIAESIIEKAGEADVPVYADSKLADTLSKLEIGEMIPPELYTVVAEILVFVDECDKIKGKVGK